MPSESAAKKVARYDFWRTVVQRLPNPSSASYLGLASAEAGDLSTLLGLGVPMDRVVLVDRSLEAAQAARDKFRQFSVEGVPQRPQVLHGDVIEEGRKFHPFDVVCLDFCAPVRDTTINTTKQAVELLLKPGGMLGIGLVVGRELDVDLLARAKARFDKGTLSLLKKGMELHQEWSQRASYLVRALYALEEIERCVTKGKLYPQLQKLWTYHSYEDGMQGTAMVHMLIKYVPRLPDVPIAQVHKATRHKFFAIPHNKEAQKELSKLVRTLNATEHQIALLLNISSTSMATYKAHATRGRYD
jgi:hypothetical protein